MSVIKNLLKLKKKVVKPSTKKTVPEIIFDWAEMRNEDSIDKGSDKGIRSTHFTIQTTAIGAGTTEIEHDTFGSMGALTRSIFIESVRFDGYKRNSTNSASMPLDMVRFQLEFEFPYGGSFPTVTAFTGDGLERQTRRYVTLTKEKPDCVLNATLRPGAFINFIDVRSVFPAAAINDEVYFGVTFQWRYL